MISIKKDVRVIRPYQFMPNSGPRTGFGDYTAIFWKITVGARALSLVLLVE